MPSSSKSNADAPGRRLNVGRVTRDLRFGGGYATVLNYTRPTLSGARAISLKRADHSCWRVDELSARCFLDTANTSAVNYEVSTPLVSLFDCLMTPSTSRYADRGLRKSAQAREHQGGEQQPAAVPTGTKSPPPRLLDDAAHLQG